MAIFNVIKYEGDNTTFIWKHPCEDFNILSQLLVHESQEAVFFKDGQALDLFGPGRYTLKTQNIPLITSALKLTTGGLSPFHCEVYFINKTEEMAIKWGTDSRIQYMDPTYKFPLSIGASGEMSLQAEDSRKLLVKLVGTEAELGQQGLVRYFRSFLMTRIKSYFGQVMSDEGISIFELDQHLSEFSDAIRDLITPDFADYGISLEKFMVTTVMRPEGDEQYEKFKELHFRQYADIREAEINQQREVIDAETEAKKTVIDAQATAEKRRTEGYTYSQERGFDVAEKVADNEAVGEFTNMGVGLGTMAGVGGAVGGMVGGVMGDAMSSVPGQINQSQTPNGGGAPQAAGAPAGGAVAGAAGGVAAAGAAGMEGIAFCVNCGAKLLDGAAFCDECGTAVAQINAKCPQCGYTFERPGKFCPKCGAKRG